MYSIVKFSGCDAVLERNTVGFFGKFSFLEDFFRILQIPPPPSKDEKTRQGGGVSVANRGDVSGRKNLYINPRTWNSIPCRVFEKTHLRMDLIQGTSKDGFEAKITFVRSFFSKINIARSIISLVNRYGESGKKLCHFTTCWGDSVIILLRFSRISRARETFLCKKQCKTT